VRGLFDAAVGDCGASAMTRLLRTGLLPCTRDQAEALENTLVAHELRGAAVWRQRAWSFADPAQLFAARSSKRATEPADVAAARLRLIAGLEPLLHLAQQPAPATIWARQLYDALVALEAPQRIAEWSAAARAAHEYEAAELHRLAWGQLCAVLDDLHEVLADAVLDASEVAEIVTGALRELTLGLAPPTLDQVLISAIDRSRHPDVRFAWIVAFNEGVFPQRPPDDALLSATERAALQATGLPAPVPRRDAVFDERLLAYIACTRPSDGLVISYAETDAAGAELLPAALLEKLRTAAGVDVEHADADPPPLTLAEFARGYYRARGPNVPDATRRRYAALRQTLDRAPQHAEQLASLTRGEQYANQPAPLGPYCRPAGSAGDVRWQTSPSELETYLYCPFKHFLRHGLRLAEVRGLKPLAWDLGSVAHELLAEVTRRAGDRVQTLTDADWNGLLDAVVAERPLPAELRTRLPRRAFLTELRIEHLRDVVLAHAARWRRGVWRPWQVEATLGPDAPLPPLTVTLPAGGRIVVTGRLDRVDVATGAGGPWLLLYDYKPGSEKHNTPYLIGAYLQLYLYAAALDQRPDARERIAGVLVAPLHPDVTVLKTGYVAAADEAEQRMYLFRPRGRFLEAVVPLLDPQAGEVSSPVAQIKYTKSGKPYKGQCDTLAPDELAARLRQAEDTARTAAAAVEAGDIAVAPLVEKQITACTRCSYQHVCRIDRYFNPLRPAETSLPMLASQAADAPAEDE
jgi:ATP-dependent helicase/nuclease subunit B